ncbi:hypothetical protein [Sutcliffiella deserti]|uniref:hypothetical protein n=1 Tax=Sutcliffiella deserti TaxID=2875501 RepID=UPI001CBBAA5F|nr:hypothetical protein [Sutcliffiella deserti]
MNSYRQQVPYGTEDQRFLLPGLLLAGGLYGGGFGFGYGRPGWGYGRPGWGYGRPGFGYGYGRPRWGYGRPGWYR